jgi:DNA-3-methyladenine glycosylase
MRAALDPFAGPTVDVARRLIGATLVRTIPPGQPDAETIVSGRIVETEAYLPNVDPSCHGYRGPTKRNASLFGRPGHAYVYFIYGVHFCFNVVTEPPGIGGAVLVRAIEPLAGIDAMRRRRQMHTSEWALASGPGNLCNALGIGRDCDGLDLRAGRLRIVFPSSKSPPIETTARVGISQAADWPLRFYDPTSKSVSRLPARARNR